MDIYLTLYIQVKRKYVQSPKRSFLPDRKLSFIEIGTHAISYRASQLWQQVPTDIREATTLDLQNSH